ncbi:unnamed protein product [Chrysoparadoxa australica]
MKQSAAIAEQSKDSLIEEVKTMTTSADTKVGELTELMTGVRANVGKLEEDVRRLQEDDQLEEHGKSIGALEAKEAAMERALDVVTRESKEGKRLLSRFSEALEDANGESKAHRAEYQNRLVKLEQAVQEVIEDEQVILLRQDLAEVEATGQAKRAELEISMTRLHQAIRELAAEGHVKTLQGQMESMQDEQAAHLRSLKSELQEGMAELEVALEEQQRELQESIAQVEHERAEARVQVEHLQEKLRNMELAVRDGLNEGQHALADMRSESEKVGAEVRSMLDWQAMAEERLVRIGGEWEAIRSRSLYGLGYCEGLVQELKEWEFRPGEVLSMLRAEAEACISDTTGVAPGSRRVWWNSAREAEGKEALRWAAELGLTRTVQSLVEWCDITPHASEEEVSPLEGAARNGHAAVVELLTKKYGVDPDAALLLAADEGHEEVAQVLQGVPGAIDAAELTDKEHATALINGAKAGRHRMVRVLLRGGMPTDAQDVHGATALMHATRAGFVKTVHELVQAGASIGLVDSNSNTALGLAALHGQTEIVQELLAAGLPREVLGARNIHGEAAMTSAVCYGHLEIARALLAAGADAWDPINSSADAFALRQAELRQDEGMLELLGGH